MEINNSKKRNSGDWNTGYGNSGEWNTGNGNTGDCNSGDWNSGHRNIGDWNTGYGNSGNGNSGIFCTNEPTVRLFNKETNLRWDDIDHPDLSNYKPVEWIDLKDMTEEEKAEHPACHITGGYVKTYSYKEMWRRGWKKDTEENKQKFLNLPNFDAEIFFEITGIDVRKDVKADER